MKAKKKVTFKLQVSGVQMALIRKAIHTYASIQEKEANDKTTNPGDKAWYENRVETLHDVLMTIDEAGLK